MRALDWTPGNSAVKRLLTLFTLSLLGLWAVFAAAANGEEVRGEVVLLRDGKPRADRSKVVVYLKGVPNALPDTSKLVYRVYQREKQFTPALSVALQGSTVEFPNEDNIFHNVFSLSKALRFDLGLYKRGTSKSVKAKKLGVIDVYCNIHPQMAAKVLVLDTKYYAVTEADGRFRIPSVPPGNYELVAWHSRGGEVSQRVSVAPGKQPAIRLELVERTEREGHLRKDGTPYGRYE
jgi:plastocyanin